MTDKLDIALPDDAHTKTTVLERALPTLEVAFTDHRGIVSMFGSRSGCRAAQGSLDDYAHI